MVDLLRASAVIDDHHGPRLPRMRGLLYPSGHGLEDLDALALRPSAVEGLRRSDGARWGFENLAQLSFRHPQIQFAPPLGLPPEDAARKRVEKLVVVNQRLSAASRERLPGRRVP